MILSGQHVAVLPVEPSCFQSFEQKSTTKDLLSVDGYLLGSMRVATCTSPLQGTTLLLRDGHFVHPRISELIHASSKCKLVIALQMSRKLRGKRNNSDPEQG